MRAPRIMLDVVLGGLPLEVDSVYVNPDRDCSLLTHEEWREIRDAVEKCMNNVTPQEIQRRQEKIDLDRQNEMMMSGAYISSCINKDSPGYVYIFRADTVFKIGMSGDPEQRLKTLKSKPPYPTEVVHTIHSNTPRMLEHQLHNKYAGIRAFGEWFHLTEKDIQWLKML